MSESLSFHNEQALQALQAGQVKFSSLVIVVCLIRNKNNASLRIFCRKIPCFSFNGQTLRFFHKNGQTASKTHTLPNNPSFEASLTLTKSKK